MRKLDKDIWIFDGEAVPFLGLPFTTRMTVVRLESGSLWIHSPIKLTDELRAEIEELGSVKYLIAPNHLHHLFIEDWQHAYPEAQSHATIELIEKRGDLTFTHALTSEAQQPWRNDIQETLFTGSPLMEECVFFHKPSETLIVTDLIENFACHQLNAWQRLVAKLVGTLAPNGKMPIDWRWSFMFGRKIARDKLSVIDGWQPKRIVMAHGEIIERDAGNFLGKSFKWLR